MNWEYSLHGTWDFTLEDEELLEKGYSHKSENCICPELKDKIQIPGILQAQGFGEDITEHTPWVSSLHDKLWYQREEYKTEGEELHIPFLCQPPKHYLGKAWYERTFEIPNDIENYFFNLTLECVKWKTSLWLDSKYIGSEVSLCTPHIYSLGVLKPGEHRITLCVDNGLQYPYRPDGHMVSDALSATWNGLVGKVSVKAFPLVHMKDIQIYPDIKTKTALTKITIKNHTGFEQRIQIQVNDIYKQVVIEENLQTFTIEAAYPKDAKVWDEYTPVLHNMKVVVAYKEQVQEETVTFGFRKIETKEGLFYLNNRPVFFRGTHCGGDFPLTGYPSVKVSDWKKIFNTCKEWGLNYIRFHSYCPPKAAFAAADEVGIYLQVECGMWNHFYEGCEMNEVLWEETKRILHTFGNHPSFVMFSPSNEPGGDWYKPLTDWVKKCKEIDKCSESDIRRVFTAQSGWPYPVEPSKIEGMDYVYFHRSGFGIQPGGTIRNSKGWHGKDYRISVEGIKYPVISHELGQWCSYPDFDVIDKFTGYLKPGNLIAFRESAKRNGVLAQNKEFAYLSGKLKVQLYKEEIEATFRTPHIYGFELLELHDYIGQGTALVGMLDPFWEEKGFITPEEFKCFCQDIVPLLRISKRVYTKDETLDCLLEFCHFGKEEIPSADIYWEVVNDRGENVLKGEFNNVAIPLQKNIEIGRLVVPLKDLQSPAEYKIVVGVKNTNIRNGWSIWVYEESNATAGLTDRQKGLNITEKLTNNHKTSKGIKKADESTTTVIYTRSLKEALQALETGHRVIYSPPTVHHRLDSPQLSIRPSFWNSQMGPTYSRGMGLVIQRDHPALSLFPTREYQEWQWEEIIMGANGLNLEEFPKELIPIVQPIDEYTRNYRLGMILECKVLQGSLLIVTADLDTDLDKRPAAAQLRRALHTYTASGKFLPKILVSKEILINAFFPRTIMLDYEVTAACFKQEQKTIASGQGCFDLTNNHETKEGMTDNQDGELLPILDGNPNTFYTSEILTYPFTVELTAKKTLPIKGLIYMPRQNEREHKGDIKGCRVEALVEGIWEKVYEGELCSSYSSKEILFKKVVTTNKVRFTGLYGFSAKNVYGFMEDKDGWHLKNYDYADTTAAIAELLFIPSDSLLEYLNEPKATRLVESTWVKENVTLKSATKEIDY